MTFDLNKILESKRAARRQPALRPIAEKLAILDTLREREPAIRQPAQPATESIGMLREEPVPYRTGRKRGKTSQGAAERLFLLEKVS
jgi:hypothetical protein